MGVGVQAAGSGAPEARIRDHARYMHGRDTNMRQCDMVLAVGALGRISIVDPWRFEVTGEVTFYEWLYELNPQRIHDFSLSCGQTS